ncbi:proteasome inhibitor PI31 subunit [Culicoides brevitarsis]|uniref:proteasome inhibitor PI31 subunit n=1 Tax=Culicoides brevitarsis TaxID=469753 RepID=UPI00307C6C56
MSDQIFGWELTYKSVESSLESSTDVIITFIHFILLKNKFKCIGIGDDKTLTEADKAAQSELLPDGWNHMGGIYKLRYTCNDKLYILQAMLSEDLFIANLLDAETLNLSNVALVVRDTVTEENRTAANAIKSPSEILDRITKELVEPVFKGTQSSTQTQTEPRRDPLLADPLRVGPSRQPNPLLDVNPSFPGIGRGDLDPFGRGGGMLFDPRSDLGPLGPFGPRRPGSNPMPGAPPGSRFDPFGPPRPDRFEPNPDHFRPPGYDDMFM